MTQLGQHRRAAIEAGTYNPTFEEELKDLINRRSMENISNTPDFILAGYLDQCLLAFNLAVNTRKNFYDNEQ